MDPMGEASTPRKRRADSDDEEYSKQVAADSKKKRATAAECLKRTVSDRLREEGANASESDKKKKLLCLNLITAEYTSSQQQEILERIGENNPLFLITSNSQSHVMRERICENQCRGMKHFVHIDDSHISSNSVAVMAELMTKGLTYSVPETYQLPTTYAVACINYEAENRRFEDALNKAMRNQQKMDDKLPEVDDEAGMT